MDACSVVQATCWLLVLCLLLTGAAQGKEGDLNKHLQPCDGGCLHYAGEGASIQNSPSRPRRQIVEVRDPPSHRVPCTKEEKRQTACLNGQCYALDLGHMRNAFCQCPAKWRGDRCEELSLDYFLLYSAEFRKAMIIGGVVVAIIILIVAISIYCSYKKGKKKRKVAKRTKEIQDDDRDVKETERMVANGDSAV